MTVAAWIIAAAFAYLALGAFVGAPLRSSSPSRPAPPITRADRDQPLDISPALERDARAN